MKSNYGFRFFPLLLLLMLGTGRLLAQNGQGAQKWVGLHNLYYQNSNDFIADTTYRDTLPPLVVSNTQSDYALSYGVHYRLVKNNDNYQQFEIAINKTIAEDLDYAKIIGQLIFEPSSGERIETRDLQLGYQRGKMFSLVGRLRADIGLAVVASIGEIDIFPLYSAGFMNSRKVLDIRLNLHTGLNYQVHKRINIGYSFVPVAFRSSLYKQVIENPILTEEQKTSNGMEFDVNAFGSVTNWRNFSIRYVFEDDVKKKKRKKRRRR